MNIINERINTLKAIKFSDRHFHLIATVYAIDGIKGAPNDEMINQIDDHYKSLSGTEKIAYFDALKNLYETETGHTYEIRERCVDKYHFKGVVDRFLGRQTIKDIKAPFILAMKSYI